MDSTKNEKIQKDENDERKMDNLNEIETIEFVTVVTKNGEKKIEKSGLNRGYKKNNIRKYRLL